MIPLVALTSEDRIPMLVKESKGFVYCVSSLGVTGVRKEFDTRIDSFVAQVKEAIVRKIFDSKMNLDEIKAFVSSLK